MSRGKELAALREKRLTELRERAVEPFVRELDKLLEVSPQVDKLTSFAEAKPLDWANMVKTFAGLAGYADRTQVEFAGIIGHVKNMSDAQLIDLMRQIVDQKKVLDITPDFSSNGKEVEATPSPTSESKLKQA